MITDKFGRPIRINLSAGNINDSVLFEKQIKGFHLKNVVVLATRAYSTYDIIEKLSINGAFIKRRRNTPCFSYGDISRLTYSLSFGIKKKRHKRLAFRYKKNVKKYQQLVSCRQCSRKVTSYTNPARLRSKRALQ